MTTIDLLDRPLYGMGQVDSLLGLTPGTARRWIDGYHRGPRFYQPVVRVEPTGSEIVTWGEFVETRLLAEYRDKGVPLINMRPAIEKLREEFAEYPLAHAKPYAAGKELVKAVQDKVRLDKALQLVVIRNGQLVLSEPARHFYQSVEFEDAADPFVRKVRPQVGGQHVVIDPLRQFGEPVVRSVRTEVIAEQFRAGDPIEMIAELYELQLDEVQDAIRYEMARIAPPAEPAA